ncbi:MAG TPA: YfiR family protein [Bacteroidia bacterium]|jgi:hypothetical protein|nr:YfiR family protein [Bacteroidia bacterium]
MRTIVYKATRFKYLLLFLFVNGLAIKSHAQDVDYKSYSLFVYNFIKYIEWPENKSNGDFVVGVLGDSPIIKDLEKLAATKKAKGKNIVIKKFATPEQVTECQLLYVATSKSGSIKAMKDFSKNKAMLIVGEREGLAKKGAALSFVTLEDDVLKFDINKAEIEQHNLKIPGALIQLGMVI